MTCGVGPEPDPSSHLPSGATSPFATYGYGFDNAGQLVSRTTTDALHAAMTDSFGYDPKGQLTATSSTAGYTSSSAGLVTATPAGDTLSYNSKQELTSSANTTAGTSSTYSYDDNGNRTQTNLTTGTGSVVSTADYDPHDTRVGHAGTTDSQIGCTGNWTDPATGLVYLRARDLDPATVQFLSVDPAIGQTRQAYTYAANSPLDSADPSRLCVGMDGTPQDRACTANDFFWAGLPGSIGDQLQIAGFNAGSSYGIGLLTNYDRACYGGNPEFWVEYGLGVVVQSALILSTGGNALPAEALGRGAMQAAESAPKLGQAADAVRSMLARLSDETGEIRGPHTADESALVALAKQAQRAGGLVKEDAEQLWEWAQELGLPGREPGLHPDRPNFGGQPHVNIGPVKHIPVK